VARGRDSRLARLATPAERADTAEFLDRCALEARLKVCAIVRDRLARAGIDPTRAQALRLGEAAELQRAEAAPHLDPLPAIPGSSPGRARQQFEEVAASDGDGLAGMLAAKIGDMARRYQDGSEPDFANASLAELFAWCLVQPVSLPGTGAA
jgi:hypothetical protein